MLEMWENRMFAQSLLPGLLSGLIGFAVSAVGWWSLLGWDHAGTYDVDGNYSGPYEAWQVIALVIVMGLLAAWLGIRNSFFAGPLAATVALTASFAVEAHEDSSGLWVVGATALAIGSFAGMSVAAIVVHAVAKARHRRLYRAPMRP